MKSFMAQNKKDELLTPVEVADILKVKAETLALWRHNRRYDLGHIKIGRCVRYRRSEVERFIQSGMIG